MASGSFKPSFFNIFVQESCCNCVYCYENKKWVLNIEHWIFKYSFKLKAHNWPLTSSVSYQFLSFIYTSSSCLVIGRSFCSLSHCKKSFFISSVHCWSIWPGVYLPSRQTLVTECISQLYKFWIQYKVFKMVRRNKYHASFFCQHHIAGKNSCASNAYRHVDARQHHLLYIGRVITFYPTRWSPLFSSSPSMSTNRAIKYNPGMRVRNKWHCPGYHRSMFRQQFFHSCRQHIHHHFAVHLLATSWCRRIASFDFAFGFDKDCHNRGAAACIALLRRGSCHYRVGENDRPVTFTLVLITFITQVAPCFFRALHSLN